jgi:hypothetical protein
MVVVWYQALFGSSLQGPSGGCTSMKYVAGPRLGTVTRPLAAVRHTPSPHSGLLL